MRRNSDGSTFGASAVGWSPIEQLEIEQAKRHHPSNRDADLTLNELVDMAEKRGIVTWGPKHGEQTYDIDCFSDEELREMSKARFDGYGRRVRRGLI